MVDSEKKYLLTIEPYVFTTFVTDSTLLYNTLDNAFIETSDSEISALIRKVYENESCGFASLDGKCLANPKIARFILELREKFMGDIIDSAILFGKPIQLFPILNLQNSIERLKSFSDRSAGEFVMRYLQEVAVYFVFDKKDKALPLAIYSRFFNQISMVGKILLFNIQNHPALKELVSILSQMPSHKEICLSYNEVVMSKIHYCFPDKQFSMKLFIDFPIDKTKWEQCQKVISDKQYCFEVVFSVTSEKDYELTQQIIKQYDIKDYQIKPKYTGKNLLFFKKYIFLTKEDILVTMFSMREIFAHQALNTYDFGKITVLENGDVYANTHFPSIGNIATHTIPEVLYNEMNEGKSWLRIRDQAPCTDCIYQWLCPSPSDYELAIGRPNLCHVKP
jgi:pseudo-rSAM protein